jgi:ketosteroid isomerase-like protein
MLPSIGVSSRARGARLWPVLLVLAACAALSGPARAQGLMTAIETKELIDLDRQFMKACQVKDRAAMERTLAPDFTVMRVIEGRELLKGGRDDFLASPQQIRSWFFHESDVRLFGEVAIVASRVSISSSQGDGNDRSGELMIVDAWRRLGSTWQLAARYSQRAEPAPK